MILSAMMDTEGVISADIDTNLGLLKPEWKPVFAKKTIDAPAARAVVQAWSPPMDLTGTSPP